MGGVPNSNHVRRQAVGYNGPDLRKLLGEVRSYDGSAGRSAIHKNHVHVDLPGYEVPMYGKRGTMGFRRR